MTNDKLLLIGCGILKKEVKLLIAKNNWPMDPLLFDSALHVDFNKLSSTLTHALDRHQGENTIVFYGACHPLMDNMLAKANTFRTCGQNCCEMLLGPEIFQAELVQGAYFLMEDWAKRWEQILFKTFNTQKIEIIRDIFQGDRKYILGLRTPCSGDFTTEAEAAAAMVGLPLRWMDVSLDHLESVLTEAFTREKDRARMPETISVSRDKLSHLEERVKKLATDKSYLQLVIRLMNKVSDASGQEDTACRILHSILDVIGGNNVILYYQIDHQIRCEDVYGKKTLLDRIEDERVQHVFTSREAIECENDFSETRMNTPEFSKAYTWIYPLLVGPEIIGAVKIENLHIGMRDMSHHLPAFFSFVALALKNEIAGLSRLKQAYTALEQEVAVRKNAEAELRKANETLESRVTERTRELLDTNLHLQDTERQVKLLLDESEKSRRILQILLEDEKQAEEKLRKSAEEIQDLYNHAPCGYHSLDASGIFTRINDTELSWIGYDRDEVVGKLKFLDLATEKSKELFQREFTRFKERGFVNNLDFEIVKKNGDILPILLNATAIKDTNGKFIMSRSVVHDMTERKQIEEKIHALNQNLEKRVSDRTAQLEAANKELEAFAYSVSHDLRAPLRHIDGYVELLISHCRDELSSQGQHYVNTIADAARRMGILIDAILHFSRTGRGEIKRENVSMNQTLQETITQLKESYTGRSIEWIIGNLPPVQGDPDLIHQIWANLLDNAIKYTRPKETARIEISSRDENGEILFIIADNGAGFDMRYAEKLFGVFQRLHSQKEFEGTGIGLATVHRIIARHGGRIWANSVPNQGATFYFTLPRGSKEMGIT